MVGNAAYGVVVEPLASQAVGSYVWPKARAAIDNEEAKGKSGYAVIRAVPSLNVIMGN